MSVPESRRVQLRNHAAVIWSIADTLRGPYKRSEYGHVILPLTLMRRLDQAMEDTKDAVVAESERRHEEGIENVEPLLRIAAGRRFFNDSPLRFHQLPDDPRHMATNLRAYIDGYSQHARAVFANFDFERQIQKLDDHDLLHAVVAKMSEVDLAPARVSNLEMGYTFEELIRRFAESSNDEAGEHFTPREVVRLMVNLLLSGDEEALSGAAPIRTVYDCACGTGGMLSEAEQHIKAMNGNAKVDLFGQEINEQSYAICLADMLIRGQDPSNVIRGNTLTRDGHRGKTFHYGIANPPFGRDWKGEHPTVKAEFESTGPEGRFAAGLPGKDDGQTLFLLQLLSKMRPAVDEHGTEAEGARVAIIHNGSPLFSGGAGSGLSEIRRHVIENDLLETIVALPEQLFYNTGIASYAWVLTNRKAPEREGRVQLIDARDLWVRMRKSLGEKRREISDVQVEQITKLHGSLVEGERVKILPNDFFAYRRITVDRPLRGRWVLDPAAWQEVDADDGPLAKLSEDDRAAAAGALRAMPSDLHESDGEARTAIKAALLPALGKGKVGAPLLKTLAGACFVRNPEAEPLSDAKGAPLPDPELRDTETIPWTEDVAEYLAREVLPWAPDAYVIDPDGRKGYEIPLTRLFHKPVVPRPSEEIKAEIRHLEREFREAIEAVLA